MALAKIALALLALAGAAGLLGIAVGAWRDARDRRDRPRREEARRILLEVAVADGAPGPALDAFPFRVLDGAFLELASTLSGAALRRLRLAAEACGVRARARRRLRSPFASRRRAAAELLAALRADAALLADRREDPDPHVRRLAATALPAPAAAQALVEGIVAGGWSAVAAGHLAALRGASVPAVRRALDGPPTSATARLLVVASRLGDPSLLPAGFRALSVPDAEIRAAACLLMGEVGGPKAVAALLERLDDPSPSVRRAALRALSRLRPAEAAATVQALLDQPRWSGRRDAAALLLRLGPQAAGALADRAHDPAVAAAVVDYRLRRGKAA